MVPLPVHPLHWIKPVPLHFGQFTMYLPRPLQLAHGALPLPPQAGQAILPSLHFEQETETRPFDEQASQDAQPLPLQESQIWEG